EMTISGKKSTRPPFPIYTRFPSRIERAGYKLYNYIDNSLYPIRPFYFGTAVVASAAFYNKFDDRGLLHLLPDIGETAVLKATRVGVASLLTAYIPVAISRFVLTHFYFSYKQFMFENPKKPSFTTKVWGVLRAFLSLVPPLHKSCDSLLPTIPIPVLEETVEKYLKSVQQLHSKEELASIEKMARDFLNDEGQKLQRYTKFYSLFVDNYVTGFWEKFAYLYGRYPLLINSSVCNLDQFVNRPATQAFRAAHITYIEFLSQLAIDRQAVKPVSDLGGGMVCTRHYDRLYAVARVPGKTVDCVHNYGITRHVVILYDGGIYKINVVDEKDRIYSIDQLTDIFLELLTRENTKIDGVEGRIPALTHDNRTAWHDNRHRFFEKIPKNARALKDIETAAFIINLNSHDDWGYDTTNPAVLSKFARNTLTGDGANRWVDKSLNYNVSKNGRFSGTAEHSIVDGSELDHLVENYVVMEDEFLSYPAMEEQQERERSFDAIEAQKRGVKFAERIEIVVTEEMSSEIDRVYSSFNKLSDDVDLASLVHRPWGKGRIKNCGCSPDAFVQMAIQLANYRDQGRFVPTYEPASARFYKNSRTETLRTVTDESCEFVKAMEDKKSEKSHRMALLKKACEQHASTNKNITANTGFDRHLFVLFVMSQATGNTSPFLNHYIQQEWLLSTSQVPNVTNTMKEDGENADKSWLGGLFGAVAKTGYGVCYRFAGNHAIITHITSYHSALNTDSERFRGHLVNALEEMSALFD
ncbi:hypothetical protein PFISCL1PPCAC_27060, partial [Pristionchus fissidentatus]